MKQKINNELSVLDETRLNDLAFKGSMYLGYGIAIPIIYLGLINSLVILVFTTPLCLYKLFHIIKEAKTIIQKET